MADPASRSQTYACASSSSDSLFVTSASIVKKDLSWYKSIKYNFQIDDSWKDKLPKGIAEMIMADKMFGWKK